MYFSLFVKYSFTYTILQDFLNVQSEQIEQLKTDIGLGDRWLRQMNDAADQFGMTLQYCMSLPRHALYSLMANTVTQVGMCN